MAPKTPASRSHQPSKEKQEIEPPSSDEEDDDSEMEQQEEDDDNDETEEGSSSEDEDTDLQKGENGNKTLTVAKSDGSDSDPDSDPDSDGSPSDYKLQPILKKPSSTPAKRAATEEADATHSTLKRCKKSKTEEKKSSSSSGGNARLWGNDDEIAVLNAMIDFRNTKGVDPSSDMSAFYVSIKGKLQADFSKEQLKTKMGGLKRRFFNAIKKCENGSDPVFAKPHDDSVFELSKKIWGDNSEGGKKIEKTKKANVNAKKALLYEKMKEVMMKEENGGVEEFNFWSKYTSIRDSLTNMAVKFPSLAMSETGMNSVKERLSLIGKADAKQLNDKWKKLILEETELNYKMLTLMNEQIKMAFNQ